MGILLTAGLLSGALLAACLGTPSPPATAPPSSTGTTAKAGSPPPNQRISIAATGFKPSRLTIRAGTPVVWTNATQILQVITSGSVTSPDPTTHQVIGRPDGRFGSGNLRPGDSYSFTFATTGVYPYFSSPHPDSLQGTIIVQ